MRGAGREQAAASLSFNFPVRVRHLEAGLSRRKSIVTTHHMGKGNCLQAGFFTLSFMNDLLVEK